MQTVKTKQQALATVRRWRQEGDSIAFVPTMGNLHDGHLTLVDYAKQHADRVVVSVFINPMQFGESEDLDAYPRSMDQDSAKLAEKNVDLLFAPAVDEIYPSQVSNATWVEVPELSSILCGEFRPVHFVGVTTIVAKLFNIVQPDIAVFGQKDYQQLFLIRKMTSDLDFPVKILGVETVRESDGLAMSSRNSYLNDEQRKRAPILHETLVDIETMLKAGDRNILELEESAQKKLENAELGVDYVSIRRVVDLQPATDQDSELVILAAIRLGKIRLIDNITVNI